MNKDTYIKVIFYVLRSNAILTAIRVYMASDDNAIFPRDKADMGIDKRTRQQVQWPAQVKFIRKGSIAPKN